MIMIIQGKSLHPLYFYIFEAYFLKVMYFCQRETYTGENVNNMFLTGFLLCHFIFQMTLVI